MVRHEGATQQPVGRAALLILVRTGAAAPGPGQGDLPQGFEREARPVASRGTGYLQAIDEDELMGIATESDLLVHDVRESVAAV